MSWSDGTGTKSKRAGDLWGFLCTVMLVELIGLDWQS